MAVINTANLGPKVSTRSLNWLSLVEDAWGSEFLQPDKGMYQFSNGRSYDSTDRGLTGLYGVVGDDVLLFDGTQYPDMRDGMFQENGSGVPLGSQLGGFGQFNEVTRGGQGSSNEVATGSFPPNTLPVIP